MIRYLPKLPSGKQIITLLILTNLIYALMLGYTIPTLMEYSSGLPIFDISPMGYSYDQAMTLLISLGGEGRAFYLTQLALDMIYPAMFAVTYYLLFGFSRSVELLMVYGNGWRCYLCSQHLPTI